MRTLPFFVPDDSQYLNVGILLLVIKTMAASTRGKWLLNNERLMLLLYMVKHPVTLGKLLARLGKTPPHLAVEDTYSVSSLAVNVDALFDNAHLRQLLKHAASLNLIAVSYRRADGFLYALTPAGVDVADRLVGDYFEKVGDYLRALDQIRSLTNASIAAVLGEIFKNGTSEAYANEETELHHQ